jgi:hypothetical protein
LCCNFVKKVNIMVRLYVNGQAVKLGEGNFTVERYNPLMDWGVVKGGRVLNFLAMRGGANDVVFGFGANRQVRVRKDRMPAKLVDEGGGFQRGFVVVTGVREEGYELVFTESFGDVFGEFGDVKLSDLDLGGVAIPGAWNAAAVAGVDAFCLPRVRNVGFYGSTGYSGWMNNYVGGAYSGVPMVPMLFVHKVLELVGAVCGVSFEGSFMDNVDMKRLVVVNVASLDGAASIVYNRHVPDLTVREFVHGLASFFNLGIFFPRRGVVALELGDEFFAAGQGRDFSRSVGVLNNKEVTVENRLRLEHVRDNSDGWVKGNVGWEPYLGAEVAGYVGDIKTVSSVWSGIGMNAGLPIMDMEGVSGTNNQTGVGFGARLGFWHGLVGGVPLMSNVWNGLGLLSSPVSGPGVDVFWEKYERFLLRTYMVKARGYLNGYELSLLDAHRTKGANMRMYVQGNNYMVGRQRIQRGGLWEGELWRM